MHSFSNKNFFNSMIDRTVASIMHIKKFLPEIHAWKLKDFWESFFLENGIFSNDDKRWSGRGALF